MHSNRRRFIASTAGALSLTPALVGSDLQGADSRPDTAIKPMDDSSEDPRAKAMFDIRMEAATSHLIEKPAAHANNGDEALFPTRIGNYSKGLPHDAYGEVDPHAYNSFLTAATSGKADDFERIVMGGNVKLVNPQAGMAFDIQGIDSHDTGIPPSPALASARRAAEAVELYWQALLRDVPFTQFESHPLAQAAIDELNGLSSFTGPRDPVTGKVTAQTLFRGFTSQDPIGPYISQFLLFPLDFGAARVVQQFQTTLPAGGGGKDFLTDYSSWLACQNGQGPFEANVYDPMRRHVRNGRDISHYVHVDVLFEAYFNACLWLVDNGAPLSPSNPYANSRTQAGFGTFGSPHMKTMVAEVATRALKAIWYQKWFVHRVLRPEAFGGLVHNTLTSKRAYPLHSDILNSKAVQKVFSAYGTYLLPGAFPEGCPQHPSYGSGHATVAGACATIVKAFFDESWAIPAPVVPSDDGLSLVPYSGPDAFRITVGGELNKVAANIAIGRNHAGIHWRSDYEASLRLGEQVAISVLRDQKKTYNENFSGFAFTSFDGVKVTV
jgi:hypothetical protein